MTIIKNKFQFNATTLKLLAAALMFLDHVHQMWAYEGAPMWLTWLGRPVFPLFLFAMAEGFHYTRNRKNYLKRLLFAAWFMAIFTTILQEAISNPTAQLMNNAFMTFFVTGLYMLFWDRFISGKREKNTKKMIRAVLLAVVPFLTSIPTLLLMTSNLRNVFPSWAFHTLMQILMMVPNAFTVEGGFLMVLLGLLFYIFQGKRLAQILVLVILSAIIFLLGGGIQWLMVFAAIPIYLYNGEKGAGLKNFFYIFYPAHIGILYILSALLK